MCSSCGRKSNSSGSRDGYYNMQTRRGGALFRRPRNNGANRQATAAAVFKAPPPARIYKKGKPKDYLENAVTIDKIISLEIICLTDGLHQHGIFFIVLLPKSMKTFIKPIHVKFLE